MKPNKQGQIVKFHTPLPDENPNQLYVVLELSQDCDRPTAQIRVLNSGFSIVPINTVSINDLEVTEVNLTDLIGYEAIVIKSDGSQFFGKVLKVQEKKKFLDLKPVKNGVETNVQLTIIDNVGNEHVGILFVK